MSKLRIRGDHPKGKSGQFVPVVQTDPLAESASNAVVDQGLADGIATGNDGGSDAPRPDWDKFFRDLRRGKHVAE